MSKSKLSALVQLRVTPEMKYSLSVEAKRLGVRPVDILRMLIAERLQNYTSNRTNDTVSIKSGEIDER